VDGDRLQLLRDGEVIDDVDFSELLRGWSLARNGDGSHDWEIRPDPTPGASNPVGAPVLPPAVDPVPCLPADEDPRSILEGEVFAVELSCAGEGAELADYDLTVHTSGAAGTWDADAAVWTLQTGLADAGRHEVLFALKPAGFGGLPETERAGVHVVDAWGDPDNVPADPELYFEEWGLPVLHLDPAGALSQSYIDTDAWLDGVHYTATMKIRGASSLGYPKNSFTLEFEPVQLDLRDHGLGRKDHLVLICAFDDAAYIRQKMVFDVWEEMALWRGVGRLTPRSAWVVVYLDGEYFGLYIAIDHIDDEFVGELGFKDTGSMFKSVNHNANFALTNNNGSTKGNLASGWEKKEGVEGDFSEIIALTEWAGNATTEQFAAEHAEWIDVDEFTDWFLLVMHLAAADSAAKNAYLYVDPGGTGFRFAPWDFNHSLGQNWRTLRVAPDWYSDFDDRNRIFALIHDDPELSAAMWEHYALLREPGAPLSAEALQAMAAEAYEAIGPSAERDWSKWGVAHQNYGGWVSLRGGASEIGGYPEERAYLEQWIDDRDAAMDARFPVPE
jgi:hypothetical protein